MEHYKIKCWVCDKEEGEEVIFRNYKDEDVYLFLCKEHKETKEIQIPYGFKLRRKE